MECSNHAIKCYRSGLEKLAKENATFKGKNGITSTKIKQLAKGMKCAIAEHSSTKDVEALQHDLCKSPYHCFGDHRQCRGT